MSKLRLKHGLHWRATYPTMSDYPRARTGLIRLLIVGALWAWAMERDWREEAEREAQTAATQLIECMNGTGKWITEDGKEAVICDPAWKMNI